MKKFAIIALLSISQIGYGMSFPFNDNASSDQKRVQPLAPTKEKVIVKEEVDVYNDTVKIEVQGQSEYISYNSHAQKDAPNIDFESFKDATGDLVIFMRHVRDRSNQNGVSHQSKDSFHDINLTPGIVGFKQIALLTILSKVLKIDILAGGPSYRQELTGRLISPNYKSMIQFKEQDLGYLKGEREGKIKSDPNFKESIKNPNYRIDENAETGKEVMDRINQGIDECLHEGVNPKDDEVTTRKSVLIISNRCAMNWALRSFTGNSESPFRTDISNCGLFIAMKDKEKFFVLKDKSGNPAIISIEDALDVIFNLPSLNPFKGSFYQFDLKDVFSVDLKKNKAADSVSEGSKNTDNREDISEPTSRTISRSSSFYIESEPASRSNSINSFKNKKSLTH